MVKFLNELIVNNKLKFFFQKNSKHTKRNSENSILLEFNAFQSYHVPVSYFANYLSEKYNSNLVGYYLNYKMIASPLEESLINKIRWFLGDN